MLVMKIDTSNILDFFLKVVSNIKQFVYVSLFWLCGDFGMLLFFFN